MHQFHYWFYMESPLIFPLCYYIQSTFCQPVFYATHDQHFPSENKERAAFWVGFAEHCGDAIPHKLPPKIIYRSAVRPITKANPNHRLTVRWRGGQHIKTTKFKSPNCLSQIKTG